MSKSTHKLNGKFVGAASSRPHFGGITKKENGITLITLIITIIVMLILTGVTLSVTLGDNGLVNKAKEASLQTQIAMDRELLLSAVVGAIGIDGKVNLSAIVLPEGFTGSNGTYTSKNGHTFTVSENGEIIFIGSDNVIENGGDKPSVEEPTAFNWESVNLNVDTNAEYKGYIAPFDLTIIVQPLADGRMLIHDGGKVIEIDAKDEKNIDKETGNLSFIVKLKGNDTNIVTTMNGENIDAYIQGLGTVTYVKQAKTIYTNEEVLKALGITNSTGTYNGTWTVIGTENGNKKLVSTSDVTEYTLGNEDPNAIEDPNAESSAPGSYKKAIWSYKNAANTLNTAAQEATGISTARSIKVEDIYDIIGEENIDKGEFYGREYIYYYDSFFREICVEYEKGDNTWGGPIETNFIEQTFVNENGETVIVGSTGNDVKKATLTYSAYNYSLTDDQNAEIGTLASGDFWLASSCVECNLGCTYFCVRYVDNGEIGSNKLFHSNGSWDGNNYGVRAVVSVPGL